MVWKVEKRFDYAEITVDYKTKTVKLDYPYKESRIQELVLFSMVGIVFYVPLGFLLNIALLVFFPNSPAYVFLLSFFVCYIGWMLFCLRTDHVRKSLITVGKDEKEMTQIFLSGIPKRKVLIKNVGNYFTEYKCTYDYSMYLERFKIKNRKCTPPKGWFNRIFMNPINEWDIQITFSQTPKEGYMHIKNQAGGNDEKARTNPIRKWGS